MQAGRSTTELEATSGQYQGPLSKKQIKTMTLDDKLRYAYQMAANVKQEEKKAPTANFEGESRAPEQVLSPIHDSPWQK